MRFVEVIEDVGRARIELRRRNLLKKKMHVLFVRFSAAVGNRRPGSHRYAYRAASQPTVFRACSARCGAVPSAEHALYITELREHHAAASKQAAKPLLHWLGVHGGALVGWRFQALPARGRSPATPAPCRPLQPAPARGTEVASDPYKGPPPRPRGGPDGDANRSRALFCGLRRSGVDPACR